MSVQRVILQGFGPFGGHEANPSSMLVESIADDSPSGLSIIPLVLKTSQAECQSRIPQALGEHRPDVWIGIGMAAGRCSVAAEEVAVNRSDYRIPDVDGVRAAGRPISSEGPAAYFSSLPVRDIGHEWRRRGIPGYVSHTAGAYLCNESFYLASHVVSQLGLSTAVGFVHVPLLPSQVEQPEREASMSFDLQRQALITVLETLATIAWPSAYRRQSKE